MLSLTETLSIFFGIISLIIILALIYMALKIICAAGFVILNKVTDIISVPYNIIAGSRILSITAIIIIILFVISISPIIIGLAVAVIKLFFYIICTIMLICFIVVILEGILSGL